MPRIARPVSRDSKSRQQRASITDCREAVNRPADIAGHMVVARSSTAGIRLRGRPYSSACRQAESVVNRHNPACRRRGIHCGSTSTARSPDAGQGKKSRARRCFRNWVSQGVVNRRWEPSKR